MVIFFGIILFSMPLFGKEGVDLSQIDFVANMLFFQCFLHRKIHCWWHCYKYFFFLISWRFLCEMAYKQCTAVGVFLFHNNLLYLVGFLLRTLIFVFQSNVTFWLFFLKQKRVISGEVLWLFRKGWQWLLRVGRILSMVSTSYRGLISSNFSWE